jgi:hypothetical protein
MTSWKPAAWGFVAGSVVKGLPTSWDQRDAVLKDGWATIGGGEANRDVAELCASQLVAAAAK